MLPAQRKNWCATRVHCDALRRRPEVWAPGSDIFLAAQDVPPTSPRSKHGFMAWDHAEGDCRSGDASCTKKKLVRDTSALRRPAQTARGLGTRERHISCGTGRPAEIPSFKTWIHGLGSRRKRLQVRRCFLHKEKLVRASAVSRAGCALWRLE